MAARPVTHLASILLYLLGHLLYGKHSAKCWGTKCGSCLYGASGVVGGRSPYAQMIKCPTDSTVKSALLWSRRPQGEAQSGNLGGLLELLENSHAFHYRTFFMGSWSINTSNLTDALSQDRISALEAASHSLTPALV